VGLLVRRAFGLTGVSRRDCFVAFWMGLAVVTWFLLVWHFVFPVNRAACAVVGTAGGAGLLIARRDLARLAATAWREHRLLVFAAVMVGLWLANVAMAPIAMQDDSVGYHLQSIRWAVRAPVVPGLANLHGPLGFTSGSTLYGALMQASPWGDLAHHVIGGTLLLPMILQSLTAAFVVARSGSVAAADLFDLFLLPAGASLIANLTSVATDLPATLTMLAAASVFARHLGRRDRSSGEAAYEVVAITTLLALAVCVKFGTAVAAGLWWLLVVAVWLAPAGDRARRWKPVLWSLAISGGLGAAWMARSVVLSGYPVFPNAAGAMPVPWRVPLEHAEAELAFIVHSGRSTAHLVGVVPDIERFAVWFPRWLPRLVREDAFDVLVPAIVALAGGLACVWFARRRPMPAERARLWLQLLPFGPAVGAWLLVAPEPRYVRYLFWIAAAVCCAQGVRAAARNRAHRLPARAAVASSAALALAAIVMASIQRHPDRNPLVAVASDLAIVAPVGPRTAARVPPGRTFVTRSGLALYVPDPRIRHCSNAPLPCTPNPAPNLRLLDPSDPNGGFAVDGGWQMVGWPTEWLPDLRQALESRR
jgi:hypothetical protein